MKQGTHECAEDLSPAGAVGREDDTLADQPLERRDLEGVREDGVVGGELNLLRAEKRHHGRYLSVPVFVLG